jgi:hypothetical protein
VIKCFKKSLKTALWGRFKVLTAALSNFALFVIFFPFWFIFYLMRYFLKGYTGGNLFLAERVEAPLILTYDPLCVQGQAQVPSQDGAYQEFLRKTSSCPYCAFGCHLGAYCI